MQEMILVCGIPGSGKTTFSNRLAESTGYTHIDIDDVYCYINGDSKNREHKFEVWQEFFRRIHKAQQDGESVIVDTMALSVYNRRELIEWFPEFDEHHLFFINEKFETCLANIQGRERVIPERVLTSFHDRLEKPTDVTDWLWDSVTWYVNENGEFVESLEEE